MEPFRPVRVEHRAIYATLFNRLTHARKIVQEFNQSGVDMESQPYLELTRTRDQLKALWKDFSHHHQELEQIYAQTQEDLEMREEEETPISENEGLVGRRDVRLQIAEDAIDEMKKIRSRFIERDAHFKFVLNRDQMREIDLKALRAELKVIKKGFQMKTSRSDDRLKKQKKKSREIATAAAATAHIDQAQRLRAKISELEEEVKNEIEDFNYEVGNRRRGFTGPGLRAHSILRSLRQKEKKAEELYRLFNSEMDKVDPRSRNEFGQ